MGGTPAFSNCAINCSEPFSFAYRISFAVIGMTLTTSLGRGRARAQAAHLERRRRGIEVIGGDRAEDCETE